MKVLHTADWHLGQRLMNRHRQGEQQLALDWLLETIRREEIDVLVVAGDIFDTPNPPNYAEQLYFDFLKKLIQTDCRHVILIGGNHDAPSKLNAPRELLRVFNIHVLGAITGDLNDQIVELNNQNGVLEGVVVLVPFLRDRDLIYAEAGEGSVEQSSRLKKAIAGHFEALADLTTKYPADIPIIATGHLFATDAVTSGKQDNIYVGNIENIDAGQFPNNFDYVALGHIHRAQSVGGKVHVRYSGSLIPVSFSEINDVKSVTIIEFTKGNFMEHQKLPIPTFRYLMQMKGTYDEIIIQINQRLKGRNYDLKPWVEIEIDQKEIHSLLDSELRQYVADAGGEVLRIKVNRAESSLVLQQAGSVSLQDIDDLAVFEQRCRQWGLSEKELLEVKEDYLALKDWMQHQFD